MHSPSRTLDTTDDQVNASCSTGPLARLAVLLVNHNGGKFLRACIESIHRFAPAGTQIILEDNASADGSVEMVEECFPSVAVIRSNRNLGFAGGNNLAARMASAQYLLLLNTDTELLDPLDSVLEWLESHPGYGALTMEMVDGDYVSRACTGRFPTLRRLFLLRSMLISPEEYENGRGDLAYTVDWVQASFLLIHADLWNRLNGLDESFFMYAEDVEFCKRIRLSGSRCAYLPGFRYLHWGGFRAERFPDQVCGLAKYADRHFNRAERLFGRSILVCGCLIRAAVFGATGLLRQDSAARTKSKASMEAFRRLVSKAGGVD